MQGTHRSPDYDALILPRGTVNADRMRMDPDVRSLVQEIFRAGKPVGVICHGPWTLIDAGVVEGRSATRCTAGVRPRDRGGPPCERRMNGA